MAQLQLNAEDRSIVGHKVNVLRRQGIVPAVLYGKAIQPRNLQVSERELSKVLEQGGGTRLISLQIGPAETHMVLLREIQRHPTRPRLTHVDMYQVVMTEKVRVPVPVVLHGAFDKAAGSDAVVVQSIERLEVECLPADIPNALEVDLSTLHAVGDVIHVRDIKLPENVIIFGIEPDTVAVSLTGVTPEAEAEAATPGEAGAEPEVVAKGKAAKEGEEPAE